MHSQKITVKSGCLISSKVTPRFGGLNILIGMLPVGLEVSSQEKNPLPLPSTVCGRCVVPSETEVWYVYSCSRGRDMSPARSDLPKQCLPGIQSHRADRHLAEWVPLCYFVPRFNCRCPLRLYTLPCGIECVTCWMRHCEPSDCTTPSWVCHPSY
jgi:hypothetical protein